MTHINKLFVLVLASLLLAACTTQKKRGELSTMGKLWHNTTAHYNGYFNAREIIDNTIIDLSEQHQDNYLELLDVYEYTEVDNPQAIGAVVDEAMKKVTVVVNLHPYSQWSDDCYLLAGQALYLKQDYESAEKAFRFLLNEYHIDDLTEEARTKGKPSKARSGKSSGRSRGNGSASSKTEEDPLRDKPLTAKERDRARRDYNREVAKRKKQRERDRRKGISTPRPAPEETAPATTAPEVEEPTTPATSAEPAKRGMVRLSEDPANTVDADPDGSFLKHRPAFQEGQLWLARSLTERDNYDAARRLLNQLAESPGTYNDIRREVAVAQAHLAIREKKYEVAATALTNAIKESNDKDQRARLSFIQAQLYQQLGNSSGAYAAYEQVVKLKPSYEMEFAARLNMAQNSYLSGQGSAADAIANLERLLKDDKNENYKDQIYYAMATVELAQGNEDEGLAYLEQCLASPSSNQAQQTEAYYTLGQLYYEKEAYLDAKVYFDNALQTMSKVDERYLRTQSLRDNLVDIAKNLETIALQDSLLAVAEMSPEEQADLAKQLYEQQNSSKTERASTGGGRDKFNPGGTLNTPIAGGPRGGGATSAIQRESSFFAYDDRTLKRGEKEFNRRWSGRPLEDNWRRANRTDVGLNEVEEAETVDLNLLTQEQIDKILSDVPQDNGAKESARLEIKKAMYELGRLYRDRLENNEKSVAILEELNTRYPGNIHELDSWYYLYLGHTGLNQTSKAQEYYDKIVQKYPSSNYAQILQNPNYAQEYLNKESQLSRTYDATYALFEQGEYEQVLTQSLANMGRLTGKHPLKPRYALLMAMSKGSTEGKDAYIAELQKVIASYPSSPEETRAKEILRLLGGGGASLPGQAQDESGTFKVSDNELHYVIVVFESDDIDLNANKIIVSDYNRTYHSLDKLRISNVYLGQSNDVPVLVLRRFKDKAAAMAYYEGVQKNMADFIDAGEASYQLFPITQGNYREILRNRSVDGYQSFFEGNY